ncbi:hypothetical protein HU200_023220 [Digitaria exilis]|uniref:Ribosomal protein L1 n=1 Tax=Digitaria exilis TaxID=1010633 RepID=A0A835C6A9_9POAL|nr:hypothetical protein HU200_023220 [Digitaria exilis]
MSPPPPQPHSVPRETVAGAVAFASLTKWMKKRAAEAAPNLLADERDDLVVLQLSLRRVPASPTTRPRLLPLPHPVVAHDGASVCFISDDRPNSRSPPASDLIDASKSLHRLPVSAVIPLSTLRTDYRPYESRRSVLPRPLHRRPHHPPAAAARPREGILLHQEGSDRRTCSGIKVGRLDMGEEEIVDNVIAAVEAAVEKVPKKWANVRALHLKAVDSVALPIYQVVPELGMKIETPVVRLEEEVGSGEVIDAAEVEAQGKKFDKKKNKALRYADANGGAGVANEESGKRKRNKDQSEDVMMQEEVLTKTEKKSKKSISVPVDGKQKVGKKGKEKGKRNLENDEMEDASMDVKKSKKGKVEEGKKKKKSMKGGGDDGEVLVDERQEDKKNKGDKSDGKAKKTRLRV